MTEFAATLEHVPGRVMLEDGHRAVSIDGAFATVDSTDGRQTLSHLGGPGLGSI
jgi:hypothetical protein